MYVKMRVTVDGWEFKNAELTFETKEGKRHTALLGAYQTDFVTDGEQAFFPDVSWKGNRSGL